MADQRTAAEFADLLRQNQSRIYGYLLSLVRDFDDADDLFQQTSVILWSKFSTFQPDRSFFAWACGIARFEVSNFLRTRGRRKLYFTDDFSLLLIEAQDQVLTDDSDDRREALRGCVGRLRNRDQELLRECYGEAGDVRTAAEHHGRPSRSVYNSLRRIRRALLECIERTLATAERGRPT